MPKSNFSIGSFGTITSARLHQNGVSYIVHSQISDYHEEYPAKVVQWYNNHHDNVIKITMGESKMVILLSGSVGIWKMIKKIVKKT